jgi:hypothetical protein
VTPSPPAGTSPKDMRRVPGQVLLCGWCEGPITVAKVGRTPKWCSTSCRHRAWETSRAAATGAVAVRVVDRLIEVERPAPTTGRVGALAAMPKGAGWSVVLDELTRQVETGKVYDRDLPAIAVSVEALLVALTRRPAVRRGRGWRR